MNRIGFACKVIGESKIKMRSCLLRNATCNNLLNLSLHNLMCLEKMIHYCAKNKIHLLRIGSDIIPFASHKDVFFDWKTTFSSPLKSIGNRIKKANLRVSMHPGQYTVFNSPHAKVIDQSMRDLIWHADFLDELKTSYSAKIVLHIGGIYGDKKSAISQFIQNFHCLPQKVKRRLVLENDEKYTIEDVINIVYILKIPAVFDIFHHKLLPPKNHYNILYWINKAGETWKLTDGRQKIHYSQQKFSASIGSHSETINTDEFIEFYKKISHLNLDIMLEVKDKNLSALKCIDAVKKYHNNINLFY